MRRWVYLILIGNDHIVGKYKGQGEGPSWSLGLARGETKLNCNSQYGWSGHGCKTVKGIYTTKKSGLASVSNLVPTVANANYLNTVQLERAGGISRPMENG